MVARRTGGLADTIREFDPDAGEGNGFLFEECSSREMLNTLKRALAVYQNRGLWKKLVKNAMAQDFSWERTVGEYVRIYDTIVERHRQRTSISASPWPRSQTQFY